jgi:hypothetical protein
MHLIDSRETNVYDDGWDAGYSAGFDDCKQELLSVIRSLAYEVATYLYPRQYDYSDEQIKDIAAWDGLREELSEEL